MVAKDRLPVFRTEASSLAKLRHEEWKRKHTHSLWQQEKNVFSIFSEVVFMQKVDNYRTTPVRGLEALA
jgi:hypothetical protein